MEYPQAIVSILVLCICVLIGIPLWWNTTKVYRASLPYDDIQRLKDTKTDVIINLNVVLASTLEEQDAFDSLSKMLEGMSTIPEFEIKANINVVKAQSYQNKELSEICEKLFQSDSSHVYQVYVGVVESMADTSFYHCTGSLNTIINEKSSNKALNMITSLMQVYVSVDNDMMTSSLNSKKERSSSRPVQPSFGYQIDFVMAVADPRQVLPSWDIKKAVDLYFNPLFEELNFMGPFNVSSQYLYFAAVDNKPRKEGDKFYYTTSKLPLLINPLESRLGSSMSTNPILNFVVYIPPMQSIPLFIRTKKGDPLTEKAFHSPRWGGVYFYNTAMNKSEVSSKTLPIEIIVPPSEIMPTFINQFRELFGLGKHNYHSMFPLNTQPTLASWERMKLCLARTLWQIRIAKSTLISLSELLDKIGSIVIKDDIKDLVEASLAALTEATHLLRLGKIEEAFHKSRVAFEKSDKAFFDASLLELLYFPEDQKYAIYVPLFLPVSLPILISFFKAIKWLRTNGSSVTNSKSKVE